MQYRLQISNIAVIYGNKLQNICNYPSCSTVIKKIRRNIPNIALSCYTIIESINQQTNAITKSPESVVSATSTDEEREDEHAGGATMHEGKRNEPNGTRGGRRTTRAQTGPPLVEINNGSVHRNCGACWDKHRPGPAARGRSRAAGKEMKRAEGSRSADSKLTGERHETFSRLPHNQRLQTIDGKGERSVRSQHTMQFCGCRFVLAKERRRAEEIAAAHLNNFHRPPPKTDEKINRGSLRTAGLHWCCIYIPHHKWYTHRDQDDAHRRPLLPGTNIRKRAINARHAQLTMERKTIQVQPAKQPMIPISTDSRELREMFTAKKLVLLKHGPMFNYVPRRSWPMIADAMRPLLKQYHD
eukprot:g34593.t1